MYLRPIFFFFLFLRPDDIPCSILLRRSSWVICDTLADSSMGAGDGLGAVDEVRRLPDTQDALLCIFPTILLSALPTTPFSPPPPLPIPSNVARELMTVSNVCAKTNFQKKKAKRAT